MKRIIVFLMMLLPLSGLAALGGGGVFYGSNSSFGSELDNTDFAPGSLSYVGGYGYGVDWNGTKIGGFGMSLVQNNGEGLTGGFGGMLLGSYSRLGPFSFSGNALLGVGGLVVPGYYSVEGNLALLGQLDVELGFPVFPWFQVSGYGGLQVILPVGADISSMIRYPVFGLRFTWGDF